MATSCIHWTGLSNTVVQAANYAVPTIYDAHDNGNGVTLKWDVPLNDSSVFFREDFENLGLDLPNGVMNGVSIGNSGYFLDSYGNQRANNDPVLNSVKIIDGVGYGGSKGAIATQTIPNNGWDYNWLNYIPSPNGSSEHSTYYVNSIAALKAGKPAIVRFKAKGSGSFIVSIGAGWSGNAYPYEPITWAETLSPEEFKQRLINGTKIRINNPSRIPSATCHITTAPCYTYNYNFFLSVGSLDEINGQWYFSPQVWYGAFAGDVKPGQPVAGSDRANIGTTTGQPIITLHHNGSTTASTTLENNNWNHYSMNISIQDTKEVFNTGCYFSIAHTFQTPSTLSVDDVTVAYAPLSRIYRNGSLIQQDYTTEYTDSDAKDTTSPNPPSNVNATYNGSQVHLTWQTPSDNGTHYLYEVSSIDENGTESARSQAKNVTVTSGIAHYEIYEGTSLLAQTTNTNYTLPKSVNPNKVTVRSVDKAGNTSTPVSLPQDTTPPTTAHTLNTTNWVKDSVNIHITASDTGYGVRHIILPNGQAVEGNAADYQALQNGNYSFDIYDNAGNHTVYSVGITNIDKELPTMPGLKKSKETLKLVPGIDNKSGIARHEYRINDGKWRTWEKAFALTSLDDGWYTIQLKSIDNVGNESEPYERTFKITYQQEAEATEAVDKAEETISPDDYEHARQLVEALDDGNVKTELSERLEMLDELVKEERILAELKEIKNGVLDEDISEEDFDKLVERFQKVKEEVTTVTDRVSRKQMDKLVEEIEQIIANKKHHLTENTFLLTATPQNKENNVLLDWSTNINLLDYDYRIFSSQNGETFQSMPAKDEIKVLEIYPKRQNLSAWVNDYDTLEKIKCQAVSLDAFMEHPEIAWNYDVIVLGFSDSFGKRDLNEESAEVLKQCILSGKGVLFGHDTLSSYYPRPNLCSLAKYVNIKTTGSPEYKIASEAFLARQGGIINYPYKVGNPDEEIELPASHASYQVAKGTVWVKYSETKQFYLTTWNNCAMIQVGHNEHITNETEQKLLMNTIYYLAQITQNTVRSDYMGQDVNKPTLPELSDIQTETPDGILQFSINSQDIGTDYAYYIEATCRKHKDEIRSNTATATVLSGLKGYSIVLDDQKDTIPDNTIETSENSFSMKVDFSKPFYVHVKAIDNAGNCSDVMHYHYTDTKAPTAPSLFLDNDTLKMISGEDYGFGIDKHVYRINDSDWMEWGQELNLRELEDGSYTFEIKAVDKAGHESECYVTTILITYHQDAVNALVEKFQTLKAAFEEMDLSQEEYEQYLKELEAVKKDADETEDIEDALTNAQSDIVQVLEDRERTAEESATRALQYIRLAERYQKESYVEKANLYLENIVASKYKRTLIDRLNQVVVEPPVEEEEEDF